MHGGNRPQGTGTAVTYTGGSRALAFEIFLNQRRVEHGHHYLPTVMGVG